MNPALLKLPEFESADTVADAKVAAPATPSVPVLDVFWKKAPAVIFDKIPLFEMNPALHILLELI